MPFPTHPDHLGRVSSTKLLDWSVIVLPAVVDWLIEQPASAL